MSKETWKHQLSATIPATSPPASHKGIDKATNDRFCEPLSTSLARTSLILFN